MMDISKLNPILNKESILKTANARELAQDPNDVLQRYSTYALTHIPLGDTTRQLTDLRRVVVDNKTCAVGTIVGPYGYGKTSTAVHLWNELREQHILSVPPFLWTNLPELMDAVYHWIHFEFTSGPRLFLEPLSKLYSQYRQKHLEELSNRLGAEVVQELVGQNRLLLDIRPADIVGFLSSACKLCEEAGYKGLVIFTDELQVTIAEYKPSRDQFFNDLFQIVKDILDLPGHWAWVVTMNDDTEGTIARLRADLLQRLQRSALHFRVREMYDRQEYPSELWSAFEKRFGFDGTEIILPETLTAIGQIAKRSDLGAGPRMVTHALSLAIKSYSKMQEAYSPILFVDDFLSGLVPFDQRGKFVFALRKALENPEISKSDASQQVVKLLAAYPGGCSEATLSRFGLFDSFQRFPALARKELILKQSAGYILRYLAEEETEPEQIEQRLVKEFVGRFAPSRGYADQAADGFLQQVVIEPIFTGWKHERLKDLSNNKVQYRVEVFSAGTFEPHYPNRSVAVLVAAVTQSRTPEWKRLVPDVDIELRFELNYSLSQGEPSQLLISPSRPDVAVFQLNVTRVGQEIANKILPGFIHDYYAADQITPLLALSLIEHLYRNRGDLPDDHNRISTIISPLRQFSLLMLINEQVETSPQDFSNSMVGIERIKDLFRQQCRRLYPTYKTLMNGVKWQQNLQQYNYALQTVIADDGLSVARGRRPWESSKERIADAFRIPGRRLTNLETLLESLTDLITKEDFSGRTATSTVSLRFKLHPLEEEILQRLDSSPKRVRHKGMDVVGLPADQVIAQAKLEGYTASEVEETLRLLQARSYVDFDQRQQLLVRTVDAVDDLQDAVREQIEKLQQYIRVLSEKLPDFDSDRYPLTKLRTTLDEAQERDQLEMLKSDVRQSFSNLNAFVTTRFSSYLEKLRREQGEMFTLAQQGIPVWLGKEFVPSPMRDILEKQRMDVVSAYQSTLDEIRHARDESVKESQGFASSTPEALCAVYDLMQKFGKQSRTLRTRLQSFEDRREDLEAWHKVSAIAIDLTDKVLISKQVYANPEFETEAQKLWTSLQADFYAKPFTVLGAHDEAKTKLDAFENRVTKWLESRREDFEKQCQSYRQVLIMAGIQAELKIPFDQEHPNESYSALVRMINDCITDRFKQINAKLAQSLQVVRYAIQVQRLPLANSDVRIQRSMKTLEDLLRLITPETVGDLVVFQRNVIQPLVALTADEAEIEKEVRQAIQQRPPEGTEIRLMELLSSQPSGQLVDLRGLIIRRLEQEGAQINLDELMKDLESLFQKNQVSIHIGMARTRDR